MISRTVILFFLAICLFAMAFISCHHEKDGTKADREIYEEITANGFIYFADSNLLPGISPSPHGSFRLKMNSIMADFLDEDGNVPAGEMVPNGSIIVKEAYSDGTLIQIAVMKKDVSHPNSGEGWIWAEFYAGGEILVSSVDKGEVCTGCHSTSPNSDLTKTFDLH